MKKTFSLLLALVMALCLSVTAMAANGNYTITAPSNGHTYEVYQIFTGDLHENILSNVKAGQNFSSGKNVAAALTAIEAATGTDAQKLAVIEQYVDLTGDPYQTVSSGADVTVPAGYYLIKDVDSAFAGQDDAYTLYLVKVVNNVTISPKTGKPTVEKKVQDKNDTANTTTGWQDSADYDIGDDVPFQLTATMGDLSAYQTYYVKFTDTLSAGFTYNNDATVTVGGVDKTDAFTISCSDGGVLTVICNDVKALGAVKDSKIVVAYTAELNEKAVIGSAGNPNTVKLAYSNNPNNSGSGTTETGETPVDKVVVFTYKVVANKVDKDQKALVGASFELFKKVGADWISLGEVNGANASVFEWNGIDDGDYKLVETNTPAGYNSIEPIEFTVSAKHTEGANPELTELSGGELFSGSLSTGAVTANIVNEAGAVLPTTGGIGTTVFYAAGSILLLGAIVLLITKKRMGTED